MLSKAQALRTQVNKVVASTVQATHHAQQQRNHSTDNTGGATLGEPTHMMASEAFVESMVAQVIGILFYG